ncbi:hypothetical protein ACHAWF_004459 [Thalassiosira exigua]
MIRYGLSGYGSDDSSDASCSSEDDFRVRGGRSGSSPAGPYAYDDSPRECPASTLDSVVIHLDVDAFYCQCEELRDPSLATRPFAIGQKHIVVTCNYVARARGVTKLMLRTTAEEMCPDLLIIEGSDLEPYRRQARRIYNAFRGAVASLPGGVDNRSKKGGMDEMYADISAAVRFLQAESFDNGDLSNEDVFVYGQDSAAISISEDQSGATAHILKRSPSSSNRLQRQGWGNQAECDACSKRLVVAARFAGKIRREVRSESGFRACVGVSVSPMLAKLASELRKPNSLNILHPWRAPEIIDKMPLRKIPGLGRRTLKSLETCLREHNTPPESFWTCSDLLRVPKSAVAASCGEAQCEMLLKRCQGIDPSHIVDDDGGLAKTVSVEDSYKRGRVTTMRSVLNAMEVLYRRLPRLLVDRRLNSERSDLSHPSTIRFTARLVDESVSSKRRPFLTKSKQSNFDGRKLMACSQAEDQSRMLQTAVRPLLDQLLLGKTALNVTKLNIAVTGFADLDTKETPEKFKQRSVKHFFAAGKAPNNGTAQQRKQDCGEWETQHTAGKRKSSQTAEVLFERSRKQQKRPKPQRDPTCSPYESSAHRKSQVDPSFLAALPEDIRAEVEQDIKQKFTSTITTNTNRRSQKKASMKIDDFFCRK